MYRMTKDDSLFALPHCVAYKSCTNIMKVIGEGYHTPISRGVKAGCSSLWSPTARPPVS